MAINKAPGCYVFGGDSLLIECVDILVKRDIKVCGIVSHSPRIKEWAIKSNIPYINLDSDFLPELKRTPFQYLFSITHLEIIPDAVLDLPEVLSINFHDGPLPRYAGLNAPAWALMRDEEEYGITWHKLVSGIDEGDIIHQETFEILPDETALSLNTKCFAAALKTFPLLLDDLLSGENSPQKQDLSKRSYFSQYQRPDAACLVDWSKPASEIYANFRALDFGGYTNPLGSVKLLHNSLAYIIQTAVPQSLQGNPGSILRIEEDVIEVATGDGALSISALSSVYGESIAISDVVKRLGIKPGDQLDMLGADERKKITSLNKELCRSEEFWAQRLAHLEPAELPYATVGKSSGANTSYQSLEINLAGKLKHYGDSKLVSILGAYVLLLARLSEKESFDISFSEVELRQSAQGIEPIVSTSQVFRSKSGANSTTKMALNSVGDEVNLLRQRNSWLKDLVYRQPDLRDNTALSVDSILPIGFATENESYIFEPLDGSLLTLVVSANNEIAKFYYDKNRIAEFSMQRFCRQFESVLNLITQDKEVAIEDIRLLIDQEEQQILEDWNQTEMDYPHEECIHHLFEKQVRRTPDRIALVFEDEIITYRELDRLANRLAAQLVENRVGPEVLVGIFVDRSLDLMVSTLGVLKAGGAYVPLDPTFPSNRIKYMIEDSGMSVIVTQRQLVSKLPDCIAEPVIVNDPEIQALSCPDNAPVTDVGAANLAYVIYTSGSTGQPKGVMVEHQNVSSFFAGMDARIPHEQPATWLAVTSLSFDISVLELFWTIARGFKVVIYKDRDRDVGPNAGIPTSISRRPMGFGLFMWGNDDAPGRSKYRLMLEGAKYFDENGFDSVWTPERHFHAFGGPYPNPAVTGAAIAATTNNLSIRAGSCVSPLHHPIRIAEDWAVIDNLSNGRVGLSFASGWQPNDFVIKPENHKNNKVIMLEQIETVRKLWRGESVAFENPMGKMVEIATLPRPVQKELPVWVTTAGNPETYKQAGALGANILTHLLGQTLDELAVKIRLYREARKEAGFDPDTGKVSLMLHTFVGEDNTTVRELVREPMKDYLRSSMKLVVDFAWSFPAFKRPKGADTKVEDVDIKSLSEEESETILDFAFERYFEKSGLFGTPETCVEMINNCKQADINEIACLLDFGVSTDEIMTSLPWLKKVRDATNQLFPEEDSEYSFAHQVSQHDVTHLQCTPSMARMLASNSDSREALGQINNLMIGGEVLPASLAQDIAGLNKSTLTNMYGPTETTIWSTTQSISGNTDSIPIGRPIGNTKIYILDKYRQPTPPGMPGEMFIGGRGVVRGYLNKPELTTERFIPNPFSNSSSERIYWTGDLASYREDGVIEFLGRIDHQVKIRGYRIELGEIESTLESQDQIRECVVTVREDIPGDQRLVAYYVADTNGPSTSEIRDNLRQSLPEHMIPSDFVLLDHLPLTPNRKVDRNALPSPQELKPIREQVYIPPEGELENKIVQLWQHTLRVDQVGINDNFFDLGGHSLLIVRLHTELVKLVDMPVSLTDLYRFPTVRSLVDYLTSSGTGETLRKSLDRAQRRRDLTKRRRRRA